MTPQHKTPSFIDRVKNLFRVQPTELKPKGEMVLATSSELSIWNNLLTLGDARRQEVAKHYRTIYRNGGIVRTALDSYILFMFAGGWTLQSNDDDRELADEIQNTFFARTGAFNAAVQQVTLDAISIGDGYAKILRGRGRLANTPVSLQHIPSERVKPHIDQTLATLWYDIYDKELVQIVGRVEIADMLHVCLNPGGAGVYGVGLLESAWDEIRYDTEVAEGTAAAIRRHGYGIWHAKVTSTDPETPISDNDVAKVRDSLKQIGSRSEVITSGNIEITPLNETGQMNIGIYTEWSVTRLCTALGIPGELLGLRQGSTDATAVSRIENYYKKIQTYQELLGDAINTQFIDKILVTMGREEGAVWIEYADPSPEDNIKRATYLATIAAITPGDPTAIMSQQQMQTYLSIDHEQWQKDEEFQTNRQGQPIDAYQTEIQ